MDKTRKIYFIGGSPCSGKSTVTEILSEKYDLYYYKVDEFLERFIKECAQKNRKSCSNVSKMTPEEIWMRDPVVQCKEEFLIYQEIFDLVVKDLEALDTEKDIITEGAAFVPNLMKSINVPWNRYLSITPTRDFQISHYKQREWIHYILADCSDEKKAFNNWMERDCLFAEDVNRQCAQYGYLSFINGGETDIVTYVKNISIHFELGR